MSQLATAPSHENTAMGTWLPLTEYAVRSGVSLSTIRRKIKTNSIPFRLEKGRYLILFKSTDTHAAEAAPVQEEAPAPLYAVPTPAPRAEARQEIVPTVASPSTVTATAANGMDQAVRMISEAFEHTLREKDERIRLLEKRNEDLEERLNELRTLVRVLEEKYEVRY